MSRPRGYPKSRPAGRFCRRPRPERGRGCPFGRARSSAPMPRRWRARWSALALRFRVSCALRRFPGGAGSRPGPPARRSAGPMRAARAAKSTWALRSVSPGRSRMPAPRWPRTACSEAAEAGRRGHSRRSAPSRRRGARRAPIARGERAAGFADLGLARRPRASGSAAAKRRQAGRQGQPQASPSGARPTMRSRQPSRGPVELADRQRVEEFVGDQQQRPGRHVVEALVPGRREGRERGAAERRAAARWSRRDGGRARHGSPARRGWRASASAISVPRPGPSSTSRTGAGRPIASQRSASQAPKSSPNIWEISGAVVKSPAAPSGRARR